MKLGLYILAALVTFSCKPKLETSKVNQAWNFEDHPSMLSVKQNDLIVLDSTMADDGSKYDPKVLESYYTRSLSSLPSSGKLSNQPWAGSYWPSLSGGIAAIWNQVGLEDELKIHEKAFWLPKKSDVFSMSMAEIAALSPAHKYEIYAGNYDSFLSVDWERQRTRISRHHWEGLCDGWASASINFEEPKSVLLINRDGIKIPFGSSDIKALLTYYQSKIYRDNKKTRKNIDTWRKLATSKRCRSDLGKSPEDSNTEECRGVNAGSFHIIISNRIGLQKKGLVIDIIRDREVWNQPVYSYESEFKDVEFKENSHHAPGTTKLLHTKTKLVYTQESEATWHAHGSSNKDYGVEVEYEYILELDASGKIIGGEWVSWDRPDYMSHRLKPNHFNHKIGHWEWIDEIYNASINSPGISNPISQSN